MEVQGGVGGKALGHAGNRVPRVLSRENPEGDDDVFVRPAAPAPFVVAAEGAKENASRPGKWTSAKVGRRASFFLLALMLHGSGFLIVLKL